MEFADAPEISAWIGAAIPTKEFPVCALTWLLRQDAVKNLLEGFGTGFSENYGIPAQYGGLATL
jgi:hypothetical protein